MSEYWDHVRHGVLTFYGHSADVQVSGLLFIIFFTTGLVFYHILLTCEEPHMICYSVTMAAGVSVLGTIFWTLFSPLPTIQVQLGLTHTGIFTIVGGIVTVLSAVGFAHFEENLSVEECEPETISIARSRHPHYETFLQKNPHNIGRTRSVPILAPKTPTKCTPVLVSM